MALAFQDSRGVPVEYQVYPGNYAACWVSYVHVTLGWWSILHMSNHLSFQRLCVQQKTLGFGGQST
jgi:hypothetical protein